MATLPGNDHELLKGQATTSMRATIENVHERHRQDEWLLGAGQIGNVGIERNTFFGSTSFGNGQADTKDSIGTEVALVGGVVELVEELVDLGLVFAVNVLFDDGWA